MPIRTALSAITRAAAAAAPIALGFGAGACSVLHSYDDIVGEPHDASDGATASCGGCIEIEAESSTLTSPMQVLADDRASGGAAVFTPVDQAGSAVFTFTVPVSGDYLFWARALAPADDENSFFVSVDGGAEIVYAPPVTTSYQYSAVSELGNTAPFSLSSGVHVMTFRGREKGTMLDKIIGTNDPTFVPRGT